MNFSLYQKTMISVIDYSTLKLIKYNQLFYCIFIAD